MMTEKSHRSPESVSAAEKLRREVLKVVDLHQPEAGFHFARSGYDWAQVHDSKTFKNEASARHSLQGFLGGGVASAWTRAVWEGVLEEWNRNGIKYITMPENISLTFEDIAVMVAEALPDLEIRDVLRLSKALHKLLT
jgi:hypothetical protein